MLTDLFESAARVQALREGPAGTLLEAFAEALVRDRYAALTARRHLRAAEHFVHWADRTGIPSRAPLGQRWRDSLVTSSEPVDARISGIRSGWRSCTARVSF